MHPGKEVCRMCSLFVEIAYHIKNPLSSSNDTFFVTYRHINWCRGVSFHALDINAKDLIFYTWYFNVFFLFYAFMYVYLPFFCPCLSASMLYQLTAKQVVYVYVYITLRGKVLSLGMACWENLLRNIAQ